MKAMACLMLIVCGDREAIGREEGTTMRCALFRDRLAPRVQQWCSRHRFTDSRRAGLLARYFCVTSPEVARYFRVARYFPFALLHQRLRVTSRAKKWVYYSKMM